MTKYLLITAVVCLSSCVDMTNTTPSSTQAQQKPTQIALSNGEKVNIRWNGDTPSILIDGEGWTAGREDGASTNFSKSKFYGLTLNFNNKTFIETGFDGTWLPEQKGKFTVIK